MAELKCGNTAAALEAAETAGELHPESVVICTTLARSHAAQGSFAKAEFLLQSISIDEQTAFTVYYEMGLLYKQWQRLDKALEYLREACRLRADVKVAHVQVGQVLFQLEKYEDAAGAFEMNITIDAGEPFALNCLAVTYSAMGKYTEANLHFRSAIELDADNDEVLNNLGLNYSYQHKYFESANCFRTAIALKPGNSAYHLRLARVLAHAKK